MQGPYPPRIQPPITGGVKANLPNCIFMLGRIVRPFFGGGDLSAISAHKKRHPFRLTYPLRYALFYPKIPIRY